MTTILKFPTTLPRYAIVLSDEDVDAFCRVCVWAHEIRWDFC
jgi:hypothetical protein